MTCRRPSRTLWPRPRDNQALRREQAAPRNHKRLPQTCFITAPSATITQAKTIWPRRNSRNTSRSMAILILPATHSSTWEKFNIARAITPEQWIPTTKSGPVSRRQQGRGCPVEEGLRVTGTRKAGCRGAGVAQPDVALSEEPGSDPGQGKTQQAGGCGCGLQTVTPFTEP